MNIFDFVPEFVEWLVSTTGMPTLVAAILSIVLYMLAYVGVLYFGGYRKPFMKGQELSDEDRKLWQGCVGWRKIPKDRADYIAQRLGSSIIVDNKVTDQEAEFYRCQKAFRELDLARQHIIENNADYETRLEELTKPNWRDVYIKRVKGLLGRLDHWCGDQAVFYPNSEKRSNHNSFVVRHTGCQPFTVGSLGFCLKLAMIYPVAFFIVSWLLGGNGDLAGLPLLKENTIVFEKVLFLTLIGLLIWVAVAGRKYGRLVAAGLASGIAFAVAGSVAGTVIVVVASVGAVTVSSAVTSAVGVAVSGAVIGAIVGADADANIGAFDRPDISVLLASAVVLGFLNSSRIYITRWVFKTRIQWMSLRFSFVMCLILLGLFLVCVWGLAYPYNDLNVQYLKYYSPLVFWVFLPIVNLWLDWLSLGITRGFLNRIANQDNGSIQVVGLWLLDVILACILIPLLIAQTTWVVAVFNWILHQKSGVYLLDLGCLFADVSQGVTVDNLWVYLMIFSTLIPTLVHFTAVSAACFKFLPDSTTQLPPPNSINRVTWFFQYILVKTPVILLVIPLLTVALVAWVLSVHHATLGSWLLEWAMYVASWVDSGNRVCTGVRLGN